MILLSFFPWLVLPAVPWLATGAKAQASLAGALVILGELLFWPGVALAGKDVWEAAKSKGWKHILPDLLKRLRSEG